MTNPLESAMANSHARLRVDLGALADNYRFLSSAASPSECAAVVKADGYGLGMTQVSRALHDAGCRRFFVNEVFEGVSLRQTLTQAEIYVLSGITASTTEVCLRAKLIPVLSSQTQIDIWRSLAGRDQAAAVKIDTGMTRLGLAWDAFTAQTVSDIKVALLMTHLACADTPEHPLNAIQLARFETARKALPDTPTSIGNTAGTLAGDRTRGDICRCGIGLYGGNPFADQGNPFRAVAYLEGRVLQTRMVAPDERIGYGATYRASHPMRIATIGIGYANGLPRALSNLGRASQAGDAYPIVGRVSMNLTTIALPDGAPLEVGDWVEFIGQARLLDEVAAIAGTIGYEILTGLSAPRHYLVLSPA